MEQRRNIFDNTRQSLGCWMEEQNEPAYRADQVFGWLYKRRVFSPAEMSNLPKELHKRLLQDFDFTLPRIAEQRNASDETIKYRLELKDKRAVECVLMPDQGSKGEGRGISMCLSSQVGCVLGCTFCATGTMGKGRDLTPGEIVGQVVLMLVNAPFAPTTVNILFMGMGEPLLNTDNVLASLEILNDETGLAIPMRRITVSTVGILPGIDRLFEMARPPRLALSLHAPNQQIRERMIPISRRYPLAELIEKCRELPLQARDKITMEYILLGEVNDRPEHARELVSLLHGLKVKVNLIPHNHWVGVPFKESKEAAVESFIRILSDSGVTATIRRSRGRDAAAACGQLVYKNSRRKGQ